MNTKWSNFTPAIQPLTGAEICALAIAGVSNYKISFSDLVSNILGFGLIQSTSGNVKISAGGSVYITDNQGTNISLSGNGGASFLNGDGSGMTIGTDDSVSLLNTGGQGLRIDGNSGICTFDVVPQCGGFTGTLAAAITAGKSVVGGLIVN